MRSLTRVRERMVVFLLGFLLASAGGCGGAATAGQSSPSTSVVVVRHAERDSGNSDDPSLSAAGLVRALALERALAGADVAAVYSTQYRRTRETGTAIAEAHGIEVTVRPIDASNSAIYAADLTREILSRHAGRAVVIVGHSNTVPNLVAALGGGAVEPIPESEYDRMYVLVIDPLDRTSVISATYGEPTN